MEGLISLMGPHVPPCRRFGVEQGKGKDGNPKVRPFDDFSEFFHNACVSTADKVTIPGVDAIANFAKLWAEVWQAASTNGWTMNIQLEDGQVLTGQIHIGYHDPGEAAFVCKCVDLELAYRQLPVRPSQRHLVAFGTQTTQINFFL